MKILCPDYYPDFHCIAGRCRHSCCCGWEIDIDSETLAYYRSVPGDFGARLNRSIGVETGNAHFTLTPEERCPFLNRDGLCDLILTLGEDKLCQICTDHPRFRSFYSGITEVGVGLCCEEAGAHILSRKEPARLIALSDDGQDTPLSENEQILLEFRGALFAIVQNRKIPVRRRIGEMLSFCGITLPDRTMPRWADFFLSLERLDNAWTKRLLALSRSDMSDFFIPNEVEWDIPLEQLAVYLLYRHLPAALEDGDLTGWVSFCAISILMIRALCAVQAKESGGLTLPELTEIARQYSAEIEYSDDNMDAILDDLQGE